MSMTGVIPVVSERKIREAMDRHGEVVSLMLMRQMQLLKACSDGNLTQVREPLGFNINPNFYSEEGLTPLHYAVLSDNCAIVIELMKHNADASIKSLNGQTALELARVQGKNNIASILEKEYPKKAEVESVKPAILPMKELQSLGLGSTDKPSVSPTSQGSRESMFGTPRPPAKKFVAKL